MTEKWQDYAETGVTIMGVLGAFWPALLPFAGYGAHALQTWKLVKPRLVKAQSEAEMYHTTALTTVIGLDEFKKAYPNDWKKVSAELVNIKDRLISPEDRQKIENVILGLRGLPPKT
ncbi:unnamed protein product [marine sediment metagenome]|uniref:Uncharacterized protein n=1 Tax=marine sediment metagenome TaxID=412755 RepID=X1EV94_9ZZZZ